MPVQTTKLELIDSNIIETTTKDYKEKGRKALAYASALVITPENIKNSIEKKKLIMLRIKEGKADKKRWEDPVKKELDARKAISKDMFTELMESKTIMDKKLLVFQEASEKEQARLAAEKLDQEEIRRKEREVVREDETRIESEKRKATQMAEDITDVVVPEETKVSGTKKRWTFSVENEDLVSRKYMSLDSKKINEAIRNGEREITGLKIYQKTGF